MVIAALADHHVPLDEPIDLLNVAFRTKEKTVLTVLTKRGKNRKVIVKYLLKNPLKMTMIVLINSSVYQIVSQEE